MTSEELMRLCQGGFDEKGCFVSGLLVHERNAEVHAGRNQRNLEILANPNLQKGLLMFPFDISRHITRKLAREDFGSFGLTGFPFVQFCSMGKRDDIVRWHR